MLKKYEDNKIFMRCLFMILYQILNSSKNSKAEKEKYQLFSKMYYIIQSKDDVW